MATAFLSFNKKLVAESRACTLGLYRSLLKTGQQYPYAHKIKQEIRQRFRESVHTTSRQRSLLLMQEAEKTLMYLNKGLNHQDTRQSILNYAKALKVNIPFNRPRSSIKQLPKKKAMMPIKKKKKKMVKRKPYQVAITTRTAFGFEFKRVRGWRQPVQTSMMMKNRVRVQQARLDRFQLFKQQLEMIRSERLFLTQLNCLPRDRLRGFEDTIKMGLDANSKHHLPSNRKEEEMVDREEQG
ncbi:hypothetical protein A0J61_09402 [Choanephora cucurbitarum]|uniref:Complex 1 LYR protein domain-containing protein n=1 Tax=Choanephora cucurbitarum TaxID=101091 RepID=A0A1C7N0G8_9FUNG|nr:hypothetical protein A0J61_09402 [Choanephora cucurbitarum]